MPQERKELDVGSTLEKLAVLVETLYVSEDHEVRQHIMGLIRELNEEETEDQQRRRA